MVLNSALSTLHDQQGISGGLEAACVNPCESQGDQEQKACHSSEPPGSCSGPSPHWTRAAPSMKRSCRTLGSLTVLEHHGSMIKKLQKENCEVRLHFSASGLKMGLVQPDDPGLHDWQKAVPLKFPEVTLSDPGTSPTVLWIQGTPVSNSLWAWTADSAPHVDGWPTPPESPILEGEMEIGRSGSVQQPGQAPPSRSWRQAQGVSTEWGFPGSRSCCRWGKNGQIT